MIKDLSEQKQSYALEKLGTQPFWILSPRQFVKMSRQLNITTDDFFAPVYDNNYINSFVLSYYTLGVINCILLAIVSSFERSGEAGPHRTLINRFVSYNLDQVLS